MLTADRAPAVQAASDLGVATEWTEESDAPVAGEPTGFGTLKARRPGSKKDAEQALRAGLGRHFWPLAAIAFLIAAYSSPAFDFVLERMIDDLQWDTGAARFLLIFFSGIGAFGLLVGGRLADSIGRKPTTAAAQRSPGSKEPSPQDAGGG